MRSRLCNGCNEWYPVNDGCPNCHYDRSVSAPLVMPDIQPYQSMIDGSMIQSRSQHRAHLKAHGCIEIGNEKMTPRADLRGTGQKEAVIQAVQKAKEKYGTRTVERAMTEALQRANEIERHRR